MKNILKIFAFFSVLFSWSYGDNCQIINLKGSVAATLACLSFKETSCARSCQIAKQVCICRDSRLLKFYHYLILILLFLSLPYGFDFGSKFISSVWWPATS